MCARKVHHFIDGYAIAIIFPATEPGIWIGKHCADRVLGKLTRDLGKRDAVVLADDAHVVDVVIRITRGSRPSAQALAQFCNCVGILINEPCMERDFWILRPHDFEKYKRTSGHIAVMVMPTARVE